MHARNLGVQIWLSIQKTHTLPAYFLSPGGMLLLLPLPLPACTEPEWRCCCCCYCHCFHAQNLGDKIEILQLKLQQCSSSASTLGLQHADLDAKVNSMAARWQAEEAERARERQVACSSSSSAAGAAAEQLLALTATLAATSACMAEQAAAQRLLQEQVERLQAEVGVFSRVLAGGGWRSGQALVLRGQVRGPTGNRATFFANNEIFSGYLPIIVFCIANFQATCLL